MITIKTSNKLKKNCVHCHFTYFIYFFFLGFQKRYHHISITRAFFCVFEQDHTFICIVWGLIAARPPPKRLKKRRAGAARLPNQACKPPHAARRPHAYEWREDGRLGVRPRRTGVLAMHACPEGVQALHALRTGVYGRHACPARLT